eukprot:scaffold100301_cov55-Attheya_sp.AAC.6
MLIRFQYSSSLLSLKGTPYVEIPTYDTVSCDINLSDFYWVSDAVDSNECVSSFVYLDTILLLAWEGIG